jgi:hypothetical protein
VMSVNIRVQSVISGKRSALSFLCVLFLAVLLILQSPSRAQGQSGQTDDRSATANPSPTVRNPVLVELFTSEGCSSCPPVDRLIQKWDTYQPIPDAQLIVMSEHVTYWDHDGWKDRNSSAELTERQSEYDNVLGPKEPYTPQVIVDGTHEIRPNDPQEMKDVLLKAASEPKIPIRIGEVTADSGNPAVLRTHIATDANSEEHKADVYVAVALDHVESQVLKGENGGKHLEFVAVVQELTKVGKLPKGKSFDEDVQLKLKPGTDLKNVRVIAFVQEPGPGKLLGAALRKPTS